MIKRLNSGFSLLQRLCVVIIAIIFMFNVENVIGQVTSNQIKSYNTDFSKFEKKSIWKFSQKDIDSMSTASMGVNYDESKVYSFTFPEILTLKSGERVTTTKVWENQRRGELLDLFSKEVYGVSPPKPDNLTFKIIETNPKAMEGKATLKRVAISFQLQGEPFTFNLTLFVPNEHKGKVPVFLLLNHRGVENTDPQRKTLSEYWPAEYAISRGYAIAAINVSAEVDPDNAKPTTGIRLFYKQHYAKPEEITWGTIAAWGWAGSRAVDYFETDQDINLSQIALIGQSRGGKTVLWAGAQDTRFSLVCPSCSGEVGTSLSKRKFGEDIALINDRFDHWFTAKYKTYNGKEESLPFDQHEVVALIAPRGLHDGAASNDLWADPRGAWLSLREASKVWALYGKVAGMNENMPLMNELVINGPLAFHMREGNHNLTLFDWKLYLDHADLLFKKAIR